MAQSKVLYTGDGVVYQFNIPFPYVSTSHLKVFVDQILQLNPMNYTLSGASTIVFGSPPGAASAVEIQRITSPDQILVDFQDGSVLSESDLDTAYLHNFYLSQEYADSFNEIINNVLLNIASDTGILETETDLIIAALVNEMLEDANAANLQARITDIDANAEAIVTLGEGLQVQINTLASGVAAAVYIQDEEPVPGVDGIPDPITEGARWYDSDDNNAPYIYVSSAWVSILDPRIGNADAAIDILQVDYDNIYSAIVNEQFVRATETTGLAQQMSLIGVQNGEQSAFILNLDTAFVGPSESLAQRFTNIAASYAAADVQAVADADAAAIIYTDAEISTEQTARANADTAIAGDVTSLDARVVVNEGLVPGISTNAAQIVTDRGVAASATSAVASDVTTLTARVGTNESDVSINAAQIVTDRGVAATATGAVATSVTNLTTQMGTDIAAAVLTEENARVAADAVVAGTVTTLSVRVTDSEGDIVDAAVIVSGHATAITDVETNLTEVEAEYGVDLTANGYVSGFRLINSGTPGESAFVILADRFAIVDPSGDPGETEYPVFQIVNGNVRFNADVEIDGDLIVSGTINGGALINGTIGSTQIGANAIFSSHIGADQIVANHILAGEISATHIAVTNLAAIDADLGSITAGNITMDTAGYIRGGQTAYNTGSGFFLGYSGGQYVFSIGNASTGNYMTWDGNIMTIKGDLVVGEYIQSDNIILSATIERFHAGSDGGGDVWTQLKGFGVAKDGDIRVTVDYKTTPFSGGTNRESKWRVKVGGSVKSTWTSTTQTSYTTRTINITGVNAGQSVTIEASGGSSNTTEPVGEDAYVKNAYIKADVELTAGGSVTQD